MSMPAESHQSSESETRERLLAAAERLFASPGYGATSVRDITQAARANVAAVSYYFGGKEGLYQAVLHRMLDEMRELRISRIETDLEAAAGDMTLEGFLESFARAFVEPLVEGERAKNFMTLFDQEMRISLLPTSAFFAQLVQPMIDVFSTSLERVGVELERVTAARCLMSLVGQLAHAVKVSHRLADESGERGISLDLAESIPHVIRFSAGGIRACEAKSRGARR